MDIYILITAIFRFFLFLIIQILLFRAINKKNAIKWLIYTLALSTLISLIFEWVFSPSFNFYNCIISIFISTCMIALYILGFLGMIVSAVRLRLLSEVAYSGDKGISKANLLKIYNKDKIIESRLARLKEDGDLRFKDGYYYIHNRLSPFLFHGIIFRLMRRLFWMF